MEVAQVWFEQHLTLRQEPHYFISLLLIFLYKIIVECIHQIKSPGTDVMYKYQQDLVAFAPVLCGLMLR